MKMFNICLIALLLFVSLSACNNETHNMNNQMPMGDDPNPTGVNSDISEMFPMDKVETYTQEQLEAIVQLDCSMDELQKQCPTNYVYKIHKECRFLYFGKDSVGVIRYIDGRLRESKIYGCSNIKKTFEEIQIGTSFKEIRTMDPNGDYWFLYLERRDFAKSSYHFTSDRYVVRIDYDNATACVSNIRIDPAWQAEEWGQGDGSVVSEEE